jgi:hypothetical protein
VNPSPFIRSLGDISMMSISPRFIALLALCFSATATAQTCQPNNIRATAPTSRYTVNVAQGTVLDKQTGLMWKRCSEGQSGNDCATGTAARYYWSGALQRATASHFAGYRDWRLPNAKELASLVENQCYDLAINLTVFPKVASFYWSSSSAAGYSYDAWIVNLSYGNDGSYGKSDYYYVRLVRGGQ